MEYDGSDEKWYCRIKIHNTCFDHAYSWKDGGDVKDIAFSYE